jgi:hypothetical protein
VQIQNTIKKQNIRCKKKEKKRKSNRAKEKINIHYHRPKRMSML